MPGLAVFLINIHTLIPDSEWQLPLTTMPVSTKNSLQQHCSPPAVFTTFTLLLAISSSSIAFQKGIQATSCPHPSKMDLASVHKNQVLRKSLLLPSSLKIRYYPYNALPLIKKVQVCNCYQWPTWLTVRTPINCTRKHHASCMVHKDARGTTGQYPKPRELCTKATTETGGSGPPSCSTNSRKEQQPWTQLLGRREQQLVLVLIIHAAVRSLNSAFSQEPNFGISHGYLKSPLASGSSIQLLLC